MAGNYRGGNKRGNQQTARIKELRTNEQIDVSEVRLIDGDGEQKGIISTRSALQLAKDTDLDLVEVSPGAVPPVCKIFDYNKYKFKQEKMNRSQQKSNKQHKLKEVRMQPKIEKHDLEVKAKQAQGFLANGNKVKVTVRFRGREMAHTDRGPMVLKQLTDMLEEDSLTIDSAPKLEGNQMSILLSPGKSAKQKKPPAASTQKNS